MEETCIGRIKDLTGDNPESRAFYLMMAGLDALDLLNIGLVLADPSESALLANRTAKHIIEMRDGLQLTSRGVLQSSLYSWGLDVLQQPAKAALAEEPKPSDVVLAVQRPSGKKPLTLLVHSAHGIAEDGYPATRAALVFIILDPELPVEVDAAELDRLYGLTTTETRLANLLMQGKSLRDCCHELGIRRPTARGHLHRIFKKTRVKRQSQLVSLLFKSIGLARRKQQ
jgi:DNA-binding CsgD family transcriptional regulator